MSHGKEFHFPHEKYNMLNINIVYLNMTRIEQIGNTEKYQH